MAEVKYRKGDVVKFRKVSLVADSKIDCPEGLRGLEGTVVQVRPFNIEGFVDTIVVESEFNETTVVLYTEYQHIRLLKRAPRAFKDIEKCAK